MLSGNNRREGISRELRLKGELAARTMNEEPVKLGRLWMFVRDLRAYKDVFTDSWKRSQKYMSPELQSLDDSLEKELRRYDSRYFHLPAPKHKMGVIIDQMPLKSLPLIELQIFDIVLELYRQNELDRLKLCLNCGTWLFAGQRSDKEFCSTRCRQLSFEQTEARKKYNREKQRRYYNATFKNDYISPTRKYGRSARKEKRNAES